MSTRSRRYGLHASEADTSSVADRLRRRSVATAASPSRNTTTDAGHVELNGAAEPVNSQEVEAEISQRLVRLDNASRQHDALVRELFHMKQFGIMLYYDPEEARQDTSRVFQEFQANYDLLDKTSFASSSRRTRHADSAQWQFLQGGSVSAPSSPAKWTLPSQLQSKATLEALGAKSPEGKGKVPNGSMATSGSSASNLRSSRRGPIFESEAGEVAESISAATLVKRKAGKKSWPSADDQVITITDVDTEVPQKDKVKKIPREATIAARKRRKINAGGGNEEHDDVATQNFATEIAGNVSRPNAPASVLSPPLSPQAIPRRVKLIVRPEKPQFTNPEQVAPPHKFNKSLPDFLASYVSLNNKDTPPHGLQEQIKAEASLRRRIEQFRRGGRFYLLECGEPSEELDRGGEDVWSRCVSESVEMAHGPYGTRRIGVTIAAQIASKVRVYWEIQNAKKEKERARERQQEEKRLPVLAKRTIRAVLEEWKKAVFHIREQDRQQLEAEELRRGHEHLDAILSQSGQLLETQQFDLSKREMSRSRSRSGSVPTSGGDESEENDEVESVADDEEAELDEFEDEEELGFPQNNLESHQSPEDVGGYRSPEVIAASSSQDDIEDDGEDPRLGHLTGHFEFDDEPVLQSSLFTPEEDFDSSTPSSLVNTVYDGPSPLAPPPSDLQSTAKASQSDVYVNPDGLSLEIGALASPSQIFHLNVDERTLTFMSGDPNKTSVPEAVEENSALQRSITDNMRDTTTSSLPSIALSAEGATAPDDSTLKELRSRGCGESDNILPTVGLDAGAMDPGTRNPEDENTNMISRIPAHLRSFATAPVEWDPDSRIAAPLLLRGTLRPYQYSGLEWLATLHTNNMNGILADEMGLGKTIQTIALLAHLACDRGIWGPHLIIVPTSVLLNWEMEFKKFLPGFRVLSYHGTTKRRKELRQGWNDKHHFNVCITSYTLASRDAHIFKRKSWYYMILDEAHMIKNFKSQRWSTLLMFRSFRRLLLTGTPLQNNLSELWALLQFLMSGSNFANLKEFGEWFSNPLEKAIEMGSVLDDETMQRVSKLHTVLRPYLLRRLKRDVEKELPSKYEHLVLCPLSKRQRFLYDEFMARAQTKEALHSGVYQKIANILMQLRKVCNHPDLFEVRPILTSFVMAPSLPADYDRKEALIRRMLGKDARGEVDMDFLGLTFRNRLNSSMITSSCLHELDQTPFLPHIREDPGLPPAKDLRTIVGYRAYRAWQGRAALTAHWTHIGYVNRMRVSQSPILSSETITTAKKFFSPLVPITALDSRHSFMNTIHSLHSAVQSYASRSESISNILDRFAFVTPPVVAKDMARLACAGLEDAIHELPPDFDKPLHRAAVKLQIAFPDPSLLQYDCGKLQELANLLRQKKAGGHRVLIFTQMTRVLDILEMFLNLHGYLYLRLDGATKLEDRQYITERFNADPRIFCFIASSRSGGVGINLTGADTVIFYDSDFNPQMDKQCEDRAHRIGQIRDVHIYRFVSQYTVEEALLRKANQKRHLDDLVIQKGEFDWRSLFDNENAITSALGEVEDREDAFAAQVAAQEESALYGADEADFGTGDGEGKEATTDGVDAGAAEESAFRLIADEEEEGGTIVDYMLAFIAQDYEFFRDWKL